MGILDEQIPFDADTIILALNSFLIVPSEEMYTSFVGNDGMYTDMMPLMCLALACCTGGLPMILIGLFSILNSIKSEDADFEDMVRSILIPAMRFNISYFQILFVISWAFFGDNGVRYEFLFSEDYGLYVFIAMCSFFVVYSSFPLLFPNFSLPLNVNVRSKWGYAYSNELGEMKKIKMPKFPYKNKSGKEIKNEQEFWNEPLMYGNKFTAPYVFAQAKENLEIMEWLESKGVTRTKFTAAQYLLRQ